MYYQNMKFSSMSLLIKEIIVCAGNLEGLVKRGSLTKDKMNKAISLLKGALDYADFKDVDMVIEVVLVRVYNFNKMKVLCKLFGVPSSSVRNRCS